MGYLAAEVGAIALFAGFITLTQYETQRGIRIGHAYRSLLDRFAARVAFIFSHVDFSSFIRETTRHAGEKAVHDTAHIALQMTRFIEQQLARVVRYFRARFAAQRAMPATRMESSSYVRAIADFKQELRSDRTPRDTSHHS